MTCRCQSFLSSSSLAKLQLSLMALQQNLVCCKPHEQPAAICIGERYRQSHKPTPGPATSRPKYPTTAVTVNARAESTVSERECTCSCPWRSRNCLFVRVVRDCSCSQRSTWKANSVTLPKSPSVSLSKTSQGRRQKQNMLQRRFRSPFFLFNTLDEEQTAHAGSHVSTH